MDVKNERRIGRFTVAGQLTDDELGGLPAHGYGLLVNVRPPEELDEPEEPKVGVGCRYENVPFTGRTLSRDHVLRVRQAVDAAMGLDVLIH
ncbi:hypothetical protein EPN52_13665 [bacterium]|nr:MAG: hypothetical protein EPN52_13665 [bacterium]